VHPGDEGGRREADAVTTATPRFAGTAQ
jgi:hypothetical protein